MSVRLLHGADLRRTVRKTNARVPPMVSLVRLPVDGELVVAKRSAVVRPMNSPARPEEDGEIAVIDPHKEVVLRIRSLGAVVLVPGVEEAATRRKFLHGVAEVARRR